MTPQEAADLAARTNKAIDEAEPRGLFYEPFFAAERERVASDLAGIEACYSPLTVPEGHRGATQAERVRHLARYADDLKRTARLYGVEVPS